MANKCSLIVLLALVSNLSFSQSSDSINLVLIDSSRILVLLREYKDTSWAKHSYSKKEWNEINQDVYIDFSRLDTSYQIKLLIQYINEFDTAQSNNLDVEVTHFAILNNIPKLYCKKNNDELLNSFLNLLKQKVYYASEENYSILKEIINCNPIYVTDKIIAFDKQNNTALIEELESVD